MQKISFEETLMTLSAMVIPVVLIMATLSLILTTSQRSGKVMDRVRILIDVINDFKTTKTKEEIQKEFVMTFLNLEIMAKRSKFLQLSLWFQYLALTDFLATSVCLSAIKFFKLDYNHVPLFLGFIGIILLFGASIMLGIESRIAVRALNIELNEAFKKIKQRSFTN